MLKLASDVWPPFTSEQGRLSISTNIVQEALRRSNRSSQITIVDLGIVATGIFNGTFDGSSAVWKISTTNEGLVFSIPYLQNQLLLVGKKGSDVSAKSLDELENKRIGILGLGLMGEEINDNPKVKFIRGKSDQDNLRKLIEGELDYILVDALLIEYVKSFRNEEAMKFVEIGDNVIVRKPLHFALSDKVPNANEIIAEFNLKVLEMIQDGTYNRILNVDRIVVDSDKDGIKEVVMVGNANGINPPNSGYDLSAFIKTKDKEYIIGGKKYKNWEEVPPSFKQPYRPEFIEGFSVLKFNF